jgi:glucose-6-phosphate isomerase
MSYSQSIDNCLGEGRLSETELAAALEQARGGLARLRAWRDDGSLPLLALPGRRDDLEVLKPVITSYREHCSDILVTESGMRSCVIGPGEF